MATEFHIKDMLEDLYNAVENISQNRFLTRPKTVPQKMYDFVVVSLPVTIYNKTYGSGYGVTNTYCRIELFARDNSDGQDIDKLDSMTQKLIDRFPISTQNITASRPRVLIKGSDGNGFHVVTVQATLTTK